MEKREKELRAVERRSAGQRSKETVVMEEKRYKYLLGPNGYISCGSAVMWHSRALGAALPHQAKH